MAFAASLSKVKTDLRISHNQLDTDISDMINACLKDLEVCGISEPSESDALILNAIKLYCRAAYTDDTAKAAAYQMRYDALKQCLMTATGYGVSEDE